MELGCRLRSSHRLRSCEATLCGGGPEATAPFGVIAHFFHLTRPLYGDMEKHGDFLSRKGEMQGSSPCRIRNDGFNHQSVRVMKIYSQDEAVRETVKLLKSIGFQFVSRSDNSFYLIRHNRKVRVSNHARRNIADCDRDIVYLAPTILPDIQYRTALCH